MKCENCQTDINPKWSHALTSNLCPMCGGQIMAEHLKDCLANLTVAMRDMNAQYPEQLNDWLLSNYNFIKTDSLNLKDYLPQETIKELTQQVKQVETELPPQEKTFTTMKIKNGKGQIEEIQVETKKIQTPEKTQSFFDRAEVPGIKKKGGAESADSKSKPHSNIVERTQYLKEIANQIRKEGNKTYLQEDDLASMIESDGDLSIEELSANIDAGEMIQSALPTYSDGEEEAIPSVVLNMANRATNKSGTTNQKDLQALEELQQKSQGSSKRMLSGGGSFSR
jgi:hypothetical protein